MLHKSVPKRNQTGFKTCCQQIFNKSSKNAPKMLPKRLQNDPQIIQKSALKPPSLHLGVQRALKTAPRHILEAPNAILKAFCFDLDPMLVAFLFSCQQITSKSPALNSTSLQAIMFTIILHHVYFQIPSSSTFKGAGGRGEAFRFFWMKNIWRVQWKQSRGKVFG